MLVRSTTGPLLQARMVFEHIGNQRLIASLAAMLRRLGRMDRMIRGCQALGLTSWAGHLCVRTTLCNVQQRRASPSQWYRSGSLSRQDSGLRAVDRKQLSTCADTAPLLVRKPSTPFRQRASNVTVNEPLLQCGVCERQPSYLCCARPLQRHAENVFGCLHSPASRSRSRGRVFCSV